MKIYEKCKLCFERQAERTAKIATKDKAKIDLVLAKTKSILENLPNNATPPEIGNEIYKLIARETGNKDPYEKIKQHNITKIQKLYAQLKERVTSSKSPLDTAIRLAIAGNVIDYGVEKVIDIEQAIQEKLEQDFAIHDFKKFKNKLENSEFILYLADNSGEAVFDKLLIETINKNVIVAVKEKPVINDAGLKEANQIGLQDVAEVISSGSTAPGTILSLCNENFLELFHKAPMIISKGQGNFEALSEIDAPIFFLLKAKCNVIAQDLKVQKNDIVLKSQQ